MRVASDDRLFAPFAFSALYGKVLASREPYGAFPFLGLGPHLPPGEGRFGSQESPSVRGPGDEKGWFTYLCGRCDSPHSLLTPGSVGNSGSRGLLGKNQICAVKGKKDQAREL